MSAHCIVFVLSFNLRLYRVAQSKQTRPFAPVQNIIVCLFGEPQVVVFFCFNSFKYREFFSTLWITLAIDLWELNAFLEIALLLISEITLLPPLLFRPYFDLLWKKLYINFQLLTTFFVSSIIELLSNTLNLVLNVFNLRR